MKLSLKQTSDLCVEFGQEIKLPMGCILDPATLLWALSGNETSFGANTTPHHEAVYCPFTRPQAGLYYRQNKEVRDQTAEHGCLAHMSYGPLQVMYYNVMKFLKPAFEPVDLISNPRVGFAAGVAFLNAEIFLRQQCKTLETIGDAYNSGNAKDAIVPADYIQKLKLNYAQPLIK